MRVHAHVYVCVYVYTETDLFVPFIGPLVPLPLGAVPVPIPLIQD